jgi:hypothetical protein
MSSNVWARLRRQVAERALFLCEYCLIHETDTFFRCLVDHIISEKHGGLSDIENLAYACALCNQAKGSDIGSIATGSNTLTRFYNPRDDRWSAHFRIENSMIAPKSAVGEVTARILSFNDEERVIERKLLSRFNRFPCPEAVKLIQR